MQCSATQHHTEISELVGGQYCVCGMLFSFLILEKAWTDPALCIVCTGIHWPWIFTEILVARGGPSLDISPVWSLQEGKFLPENKSLVWDCLFHVAAWVLTLWWPSIQENSVPQTGTLPGLGPMIKYPQKLFCLFSAALSGIRLVKWSLLGLSLWGRLMQRNTKSWTEIWGVLPPELPVLPLCEPGSGKLLKGQIPKGRLWICHTYAVWCETKAVAVLQAQALPDAVWISVKLVPIPEINLHPICGGVSLHLSVCFV